LRNGVSRDAKASCEGRRGKKKKAARMSQRGFSAKIFDGAKNFVT
jgi:hypothetical protein